MRLQITRWLLGAAAGTGLVLVACGGDGSTASQYGGGGAAATSAGAAAGSSAAAAAGLTISSANVSGLGAVLVTSSGRTIYVLSSEAGGKLTCTDANGCTAVWPDIELPSGVTAATAGSGVQASQLGTVRTADGKLYATYGGYPLYTFAHDTGPMQKNGEGIQSFGGTWTAIAPSGAPVTGTGATSGGY